MFESYDRFLTPDFPIEYYEMQTLIHDDEKRQIEDFRASIVHEWDRITYEHQLDDLPHEKICQLHEEACEEGLRALKFTLVQALMREEKTHKGSFINVNKCPVW